MPCTVAEIRPRYNRTSAYGRVNHVPMSWLTEKGKNDTQFRFLFIISVLSHPMNVYEGKCEMSPLEKINEEVIFSKAFEILQDK